MSSQKLALLTPLVGVTKTYTSSLILAPARAVAEVRLDDFETIKVYEDPLLDAKTAMGIRRAAITAMASTARGDRACSGREPLSMNSPPHGPR